MDRVVICTEDGVKIVGAWMPVAMPRAVAILLHMMPATKESFLPLQTALAAVRIASLAIDLRGHGESIEGRHGARLAYQDFADSGHQESARDIAAAAAWAVQQTGLRHGRLVLCGASIGANLALAYAAAHPDIPAIVAMSPGLLYRGIAATPATTSLMRAQNLLLVASDEDTYAADSMEKLAERCLAKTTVLHLQNAGHGTAMWEKDPDLVQTIVEWFVGALPE
jgi:pimeloyl-ACP methyl ester carboxylesterase